MRSSFEPASRPLSRLGVCVLLGLLWVGVGCSTSVSRVKPDASAIRVIGLHVDVSDQFHHVHVGDFGGSRLLGRIDFPYASRIRDVLQRELALSGYRIQAKPLVPEADRALLQHGCFNAWDQRFEESACGSRIDRIIAENSLDALIVVRDSIGAPLGNLAVDLPGLGVWTRSRTADASMMPYLNLSVLIFTTMPPRPYPAQGCRQGSLRSVDFSASFPAGENSYQWLFPEVVELLERSLKLSMIDAGLLRQARPTCPSEIPRGRML